MSHSRAASHFSKFRWQLEGHLVKRFGEFIHGLVALGLVDRHRFGDDFGVQIGNFRVHFLTKLGLALRVDT